jgi:hypothetical protein
LTGRAILIGMVCACSLSELASSQSIDSTAPVRVPDRPPKPDSFPPQILSDEKSIVQIHGRWVENIAQCPGSDIDPPVGSLFASDTLIRWGDATCSVRDIQKTDSGAEVSALCVTSDGRRRENIALIREGRNRMRVNVSKDLDPIFLTRCPR